MSAAAHTSTLHPLADRLVVRPAAREEATKSGILLPDTTRERPQRGEVIAIGNGRTTQGGERIALEVKVGDTVLFTKYGGTEFTLEGEELLILGEKDILAIIAG